MEGYSDSVRLYEGALKSAGATQLKYNLWMQGTEAHLNQLKATAEGLWLKVFNSEGIKGLIDLATSLVGKFDWLVSKIGTIPAVLATLLPALSLVKKQFSAISFSGGFDEQGKFNKQNLQLSGFLVHEQSIKQLIERYRQLKVEWIANSRLAQEYPTLLQRVGIGFQALTGKTIMQTVALVGLKATFMALNMVAGVLIGMAVSAIINGFIKWINTSKELAQATDELVNNFRQNTQTITANIQSLSSIADEYDMLTSKTTLTSEEHQRLLELNKQIADISPSVVRGYDSQGNAIIKLTNGTKDLIKEQQSLLDMENQKLIKDAGMIFSTYQNKLKETQKKIEETKGKIDALYESKEVGKGEYAHTEYGITDLRKMYDSTGDQQFLQMARRKEESLKPLNAELSVYNSQIKQMSLPMKQLTQALISSNKAYKDLDPSIQKVIQDQAELMDISKYSNENDFMADIDNLINSLNSSTLTDALKGLNDIKQRFVDGKIDANTYGSNIKDALQKVAEIINRLNPDAKATTESLAKLFNINTNPSISTVRNFDDILQDVSEQVKSAESDVSKLNKVLDQHKQKGDWDIKTIAELAQTYPSLLDKFGDDIALEKEIIKIKDDKVTAIKNSYSMELKVITDYLNSVFRGYGTDVSQFKSAQEAKLKIQNDFNNRLKLFNDVIIVEQKKILTTMLANLAVIGEDEYMLAKKRLAMIVNVRDGYEGYYKQIDTTIDNYFRLVQLGNNLNTVIDDIGTSSSANTSNSSDKLSQMQSQALSFENTIVQALKAMYQEDYENQKKALDEKQKAEEDYYNGKIKQLQDQIDALEDTAEEKKNNLEKMKQELELWKRQSDDVYAQGKIKELEKQIADTEKELQITDLNKQKDVLQDELDANKQGYQIEQDELKKHYDEMINDDKLYAEARKLIFDNNQKDIVALLEKYAPEFARVGTVLGQSMADAMAQKVKEEMDNITDLSNGNTSGSNSSGSTSTAPSANSSNSSSSTTSNTNAIPWDGRYYQYGSSGETVKRIQKNLNAVGYNLVVDGIFGGLTAQAIRDFQRKNGLSVDGIVGRNTWSKLIKFKSGGFTGDWFGEGGKLAVLDKKERILTDVQTKAFDHLIYNILPKFTNGNIIDMIDKVRRNTNVFNAPVVQNDIRVVNNTPFDVNNNLDNLNRAIKQGLMSSGYRINPISI